MQHIGQGLGSAGSGSRLFLVRRDLISLLIWRRFVSREKITLPQCLAEDDTNSSNRISRLTHAV